MPLSHSLYKQYHQGFTLIETIVGIVVLAISLSVLTSLIYPIAEQSADQLHQIKAAELAQSVLNEIQQKAFDENSDMAGGRIRCGELTVTCTNGVGPELGETRATFNDVDDYNGLIYNVGELENSQEEALPLYMGYAMSISVCNDGDYDGNCDASTSTAKFIRVTITTPTGFSMDFSTYRVNF